MQGLIIVATLVALVASLVVIMTRQTTKSQPIKVVTQPKRRQLRRPSKDRQKRYYQRKIRTMERHQQFKEQQWLLLIATLAYHHYCHEQAIPNYN